MSGEGLGLKGEQMHGSLVVVYGGICKRAGSGAGGQGG